MAETELERVRSENLRLRKENVRLRDEFNRLSEDNKEYRVFLGEPTVKELEEKTGASLRPDPTKCQVPTLPKPTGGKKPEPKKSVEGPPAIIGAGPAGTQVKRPADAGLPDAKRQKAEADVETEMKTLPVSKLLEQYCALSGALQPKLTTEKQGDSYSAITTLKGETLMGQGDTEQKAIEEASEEAFVRLTGGSSVEDAKAKLKPLKVAKALGTE